MKIGEIKLNEKQIEVNLKFYTFLKELNSVKPKKTVLETLKDYLARYSNDIKILKEQFGNLIDQLNTDESFDTSEMLETFRELTDNELIAKCFSTAIKLYEVKDFFLEETKLHTTSQAEKLYEVPLLSLKYDSLTKYIPYSQRVTGALLTALLFDKIANGHKDFLSDVGQDYVDSLIDQCKSLKENGVNLDQMFSLMFQESINQSIKSSAGGSYEERITQYLISIGIPREDIEKVHDSEDSSFEIDHKIKLNGKIIAISAKRTLRERYKQFIKTIQSNDTFDLLLTVTLGTDLTTEKAKAIRKHNVYIFIADEIYVQNKGLREIDGVFPISQLSKELFSFLLKK